MRFAAFLLILGPSGCTDQREVAPPPAYSQAPPYAPGVYATAPGSPPVTGPAADTYCAEAVAEAEAAAVQATGHARDAGRAERTARFAARDCR